jgi:Na+/glutamate symporter
MNNVAKKSIKNMDAVVTGVILGGIVASLYGVKKIRDTHKEHGETHPIDNNQTNLFEHPKPIERKSLFRRIFGK